MWINLKKSFNFIYLFIIFLSWNGVVWGNEGKDRIISLKPNITEILFELGVGDRVVGVTTYCDHPEAVRKIQKVADYVHVDVEKVIALKPNLVIGSKENSIQKDVEFLKNEGIAVHLFSFDRLNETYDSIRGISHLLHVEAKGEEMIGKMKEDLASLKPKIPANSLPVLMVVGTRPLVVVGKNNLLDDLLVELGFSNIARGSTIKYPTYTYERFIASQPAVVFDLSMGSEKTDAKAALAWYQHFDSVPAVKNNKIFFLNMEDFLASPRLIIGAKQLVGLMGR